MKKKIICTSVSALVVIIAALTGGGLYIPDYALKPDADNRGM